MIVEVIEPINVSELELAKFWGADVTRLTTYQQALVAGLFKKLKQRQPSSMFNPHLSL
jgi:hypothetical protein